MTVQELIDKLKEYPADMVVVVDDLDDVDVVDEPRYTDEVEVKIVKITPKIVCNQWKYPAYRVDNDGREVVYIG